MKWTRVLKAENNKIKLNNKMVNQDVALQSIFNSIDYEFGKQNFMNKGEFNSEDFIEHGNKIKNFIKKKIENNEIISIDTYPNTSAFYIKTNNDEILDLGNISFIIDTKGYI